MNWERLLTRCAARPLLKAGHALAGNGWPRLGQWMKAQGLGVWFLASYGGTQRRRQARTQATKEVA